MRIAGRMSPIFGLLCLFLLWPGRLCAQVPESVCLQCHADLAGELGEPVAKWRGSIHAENVISCHHCHGGDPTDMVMAMSPERGFLGVPAEEAIPGFCGRCHAGVEKDYLDSAHGQALGAGGPQCATCHGSHAIDKASPDLINRETCTQCHDYGRADLIRAAIVETDRAISNLENELGSLHRRGVVVKELQGSLFAQRNEFHRLFHSVDVERVRQQTARFQAELAEIDEKVEAIRAELRQRRLWGGVAVLLLVVGGIAALLLHRSYVKES